MKRLFSILFMNAWKGLRRTISLVAVGAVALGVAILVVASHVDAGPLVHSSEGAKQTLASITHNAATSSPLSMLNGNSPTTPKSVQPKQGRNKPVIMPAPMPTGQTPAPQLAFSPGQITACTQASGQPLYTLKSAQITFRSAVTTAGAISWYWEVQAANNGTTTDTQQSATVTNIATGDTTITIPSDNSQMLLNFSGDGVSTYQFRLHVTGAVSLESGWLSVPQNNTTCE